MKTMKMDLPTIFSSNRLQHKCFFVALFLITLSTLLLHFQARRTRLEMVTSYTSLHQKPPVLSSAQVDVFQRLDKNFNHFLLFNAFDDYRSSMRLVRVIAIGNRFVRLALYCHIMFHDKLVVVPADDHREYFLPFMQQVTIDGFFLRCSFTSRGRPLAVSISTSASSLGANLIKIRRIPRPDESSHDQSGVASCVAPLFGSFSSKRLAEWIEVNRLLGVEHFVFYNVSLSTPISNLLHHYKRRGLISVVQWPLKDLPFPVMKIGTWPPDLHKLHYIGQFVAFNDCLYRSVNRHRYIIFIDIDELAVPYKDANLTAYLDRVTNHSDVSAVAFRNVYFSSDYPEDETLSESTKSALTLLKRTWREKRVLSGHIGAKLALVKDRVVIMQVHNYAFKWSGSGTLTAKEEDALLQHYRSPPSHLRLAQHDPGRKETRLLVLARTVAERVRAAVAAA